jgi:hypothetical protein
MFGAAGKLLRVVHKTKKDAGLIENAASLSGPLAAGAAAYFGAMRVLLGLGQIFSVFAQKVMLGQSDQWAKDIEKNSIYKMFEWPKNMFGGLAKKSFQESLKIYLPPIPNDGVEALRDYSENRPPAVEEGDLNSLDQKKRDAALEEKASENDKKWQEFVREQAAKIGQEGRGH